MRVKYEIYVNEPKSNLYVECNTGVLLINKYYKIGMLNTWIYSYII